jgi:predicted HAD superfamily hydrolase
LQQTAATDGIKPMGKRIVSFDIFDTLLTRTVAVPRDLFLTVGEELRRRSLLKVEASEFARLRATAEMDARLALTHRETNFDEIYAQLRAPLAWNDLQTKAAQQLELNAERSWLRPAPGADQRVHQARAEADHLLFISDMYLPASFIQELLQEHGFWREGDQLFVSGETRCSKSSGGLFTHLRENATPPWH